MKKTFQFQVAEHEIRVINNWFSGAKLYVDGEARDSDSTWVAFSRETLMSANLGEQGILEIVPISRVFSVEMEAYLRHGKQRVQVFSSETRQPANPTVSQ